MHHLLITAIVLLSISNAASAFCKYKAADGSWTYAKSCAPLPEKQINESAALRLKKNAKARDPGSGVEPRRLRGYEYSDTTRSGMRIRLVEPNKTSSKDAFTNQ